MPKAIVLVLLLLSFSAVFVLLYVMTPLPSLPTPQQCRQSFDRNGDPIFSSEFMECSANAQLAYDVALGRYAWAIWPHQTWLQMAEASSMLSAFGFLWFVLRSRQFPSFMRLSIGLPTAVRALALVAIVGGSLVFALAAMLVLSNYNPEPFLPMQPRSYLALYNLASSVADSTGLHFLVTGWTEQWTVGQSSFGLEAFSAFVVAAIGLLVVRLDRGLWPALRDTLTLYVGPALLIFEAGLLLLNRIAMTMSAMQAVAGWEATGVPLLSNWVVLTISAFLSATLLLDHSARAS